MRLFTITAGLGILALALLRTGNADEKNAPPTGTPQPGETKGPRFDAERFIKDHDKNNDGKLSKDELPPNMRDSFAEIDTNKDGFITKGELQQHAERMARQRPQMVEIVYYAIDIPEPEVNSVAELQQAYDLLRKLDVNKDGKIDEKEFASFRDARRRERVDSIFQYLDKNNDGKISKDEARGLWADNFNDVGTNHDGLLDRSEVEKALSTNLQGDKNKPAGRPEK